jgi:hypothetical protein
MLEEYIARRLSSTIEFLFPDNLNARTSSSKVASGQIQPRGTLAANEVLPLTLV